MVTSVCEVGTTPRNPTSISVASVSDVGRGVTIVLVVAVTSLPSRSTTITAWPLSFSRISFWSWVQPVTSVPLNDTIVSPGLEPGLLRGRDRVVGWCRSGRPRRR